jgi:hypothetical protein
MAERKEPDMAERDQAAPMVQTSAAEDYPAPKAGRVTRWILTTPEKETVGSLLFDQQGVYWTPAFGVSEDAQEYGDEVLSYLRGHKAEGIDLADTLDGIKDAYAGDLVEDSVRYVPSR